MRASPATAGAPNAEAEDTNARSDHDVHRTFQPNGFSSAADGNFVAVAPTFLTPAQALELTSIGTLFAFIVVAGGVIGLRIREPKRPRLFKCTGYPVTSLLTIGAWVALMLGLSLPTGRVSWSGWRWDCRCT